MKKGVHRRIRLVAVTSTAPPTIDIESSLVASTDGGWLKRLRAPIPVTPPLGTGWWAARGAARISNLEATRTYTVFCSYNENIQYCYVWETTKINVTQSCDLCKLIKLLWRAVAWGLAEWQPTIDFYIIFNKGLIRRKYLCESSLSILGGLKF